MPSLHRGEEWLVDCAGALMVHVTPTIRLSQNVTAACPSRKSIPLLLVLVVAGYCTAPRTILLHVRSPVPLHDSATVFVAGNLPVLGNWRPDAIPMQRVNDSDWVFRFQVPAETRIELKTTLGDWNSQAIFESGRIPENVAFQCRTDTSVELRPVCWGFGERADWGGVTGTVRKHSGMEGENLRHPRDVFVWLPPSYEHETEKRYPVLYMHDGQNVFDPRTSFIGFDWRIDEVADSLIRSGDLQEILVVAIANSPDRNAEYSDTDLGRHYASFVAHRLKPFIDSSYRTLSDPAHTGVMGSSMGGLISFLFAWWYPDVFGQAACLSSAFLADEESILKKVGSYQGERKRVRFYLDCGDVDLESRLLPGMWDMASLLKRQGYIEGQDLVVFHDAGAAHNEPAWAARVWRPLKFMFAKDR